jgi:endonuclease III
VDQSLEQLRQRLVREGDAEFKKPPQHIRFTGNEEADELLHDLHGHPHAFVFGCLVDRQVSAERAWMVPTLIRRRLGTFEFADLMPLSEDEWMKVMHEPTPAHRLPGNMAVVLHRATQRIASHYQGDAAKIWGGTPSSAKIVRRFVEFHGAGPKIATMAANILAGGFHVPLSDYRYVDISADVQIRRVMARLGFVEDGASPEVVIYAARDLNPDFPGVFDSALWDIGRNLCRPQLPRCPECRLSDLCAHARTHGART